jgi:hypothetical protein
METLANFFAEHFSEVFLQALYHASVVTSWLLAASYIFVVVLMLYRNHKEWMEVGQYQYGTADFLILTGKIAVFFTVNAVVNQALIHTLYL